MSRKKIVIALGGNALGENLREQKEAVIQTAETVVQLAKEFDVVVTHGNGPQVGLIQDAMSRVCDEKGQCGAGLTTSVAMSQGYIGIDLQNAIKYALYRCGMDRKVSTILSQVVVDRKDAAFSNPTKPIGAFFSKEEAVARQKRGIACMEDAGRGYRIVVPSPKPIKICELKTIQTLLEAGHIVITCGGGGIPMVETDGRLEGVDAVIDKDAVSALLAQQLAADVLVILTAVEKVAINFGKPDQKWLDRISTAEAMEYIRQEQFAKGSMLPKIEAAIQFADSGAGRQTLITLLSKAADGIAGKTGTVIYSGSQGVTEL